MKALRLVAAVVIFAVGCAPKVEGDDWVNANTRLWLVDSISLEFGECSDAPWFRRFVHLPVFPPDAGPAYIAYVYSNDRKTAEAARCAAYDVGSCAQADLGTYSVSGNELTLTQNGALGIGADGGCSIHFDTTIVMTEAEQKLSVEHTIVVTLQDIATGACDEVEAAERAAAPNGFGLEGCVAVSHIDATRHE